MSKRTGKPGKLQTEKTSIKVKLRKSKRNLEQSIQLAESEVHSIDEALESLYNDKAAVLTKIQDRVDDMKRMLDQYADKLFKKVSAAHEQNIIQLSDRKNVLVQKLESYKADMEKCENAFKKQGDTKPVVSEKKVMQMVYDSIGKGKYKQERLYLNKITFEEGKQSDLDKRLSDLIGLVLTTPEELNEMQNRIEKIVTLECENKEVTALSWSGSTDGDIVMCLSADKDIITVGTNGVKQQHVTVDHRVDDFVVLNDGTILATSPDSFCIRRIDNIKGDGKRKSRAIVESDMYLHGITFTVDRRCIAACCTDTPNYSKVKPKTNAIIEYSLQGHELNRILIRDVNGKLYRIAQNTDRNYIITFPKDGRVYSITPKGEVHGYLTTKQLGNSESSTNPGFWPSGVCCNSKGNIIVSDWNGKRIIMLDANCKFLRTIGSHYTSPNAIAINTRLDSFLVGDQGVIEVWKI